MPADELTDPLGLAGFPLKPLPDATDSGVGFADEPSANRDPFRPGADPRWPSSQGGVANRASPALDPDADPFGSARANADPFAAGGDDPFAQPRGQRAFADTHIDDTGGDSATARAGDLGDFEIDDRDDAAFADGPVAPASAAEVKKLLNREGSGEGAVDDLRALLGDAAARTPQPFKPPRLDPRADAGTSPSEPDPGAWTAPRGAAPVGPGSGKHALPPRGAPVTPIAPQDGFQQHESTWTQPPGVLPGAELMPPAVPATLPEGAGELAFEVAKLRDEARRVKLALEAVRQADPEKVRIAVLALRDQELGRQAREIAELRRELALLHEEMGKRQAELDLVTEDMITKEDTIDELSTRLEQLDPSFRRPGVSRDSPSPPSTALASGEANEDLKNLEF
ncbi:hypothetical protein HY251_04005 [bacterium]|nr:hypothetical protein [bacterium]